MLLRRHCVEERQVNFLLLLLSLSSLLLQKDGHTHTKTPRSSLCISCTHTHTQSYKREKRRNQKKVIEKRTVAWAGHQNPAANGLSFMGSLPTTTWKETCLVQCLRTLTMRTLRVTLLTSWLLTRPISENGARIFVLTTRQKQHTFPPCL